MKVSKFSLVLVVLGFQMVLVSNVARVQAQEKAAITLGHIEQFHSEILNESRSLEVHVPDDFSTSEESYPLAIVLDGRDLFRYTVAFLDVLTPNFFPKMVVVGLPNTDRNRDLNVRDGRETGAAKFRMFIERELLPYLSKAYRASGYRILMGHSLAGLFTLHTALQQPRLFNAYIATSPSMASERAQVTINNDLERLSADLLAGRYLYFSAGGEEREALLRQIETLDQELARREIEAFSWDTNVFDQEGHFPTKGFYQGMRRVFSDWAPPTEWFFSGTLEELKEHYQLLSTKYGTTVKPPSDIIYSLRRRLERTDKDDEHLAATVYHVEQHPHNSALYLVLADLYVARSEEAKAISTLEKGLEINPGAEDIIAKLAELQQ